MRGVPVRVEVGPRDLEEGKVVIFRRDTCEKDFYALDNLTDNIDKLLKTIQKDMLDAARVRRDERIKEADSVDEILQGVDGGNFVLAGWCGSRECEDEVKIKTAATARVFAEKHTKCKCAVCGKKAEHTVIFARAY
jgi:prolyl-tRNA synthetase